ncbi:helix-turn-helix transcriptional regulator [Actinotalea sp.]|uniref:helix-turn-helix transcriptional regulator n=1 Tax=Actinotalea sp. TaxID=1872145 RepID=UPI00356AD35A
MTTLRTDPVRRGLDRLARSGLPWDAFVRGALDLLGRAVPFDAACIGPVDPSTGLLTGSVKTGMGDERDLDFLRLEYLEADINSFLDLARRPVPVAILAEETEGHPERVARHRELFVPHWDLAHEMRGSAVLDGEPWAAIGLYRAGDTSGFSPAEADFLADVVPTIARGMRSGIVAEVAAAALTDLVPGVDGPAVLVVGAHDSVLRASPAAAARVDELGGSIWGRLPEALGSIVSAARAFGAGGSDLVPRLRVRAPSGQWLVIHASPLAGPTGTASDVVVTIEEARPADVVPLVVAAFGLTGREREVVDAVVRGASTQQIAGLLHLSPYTVQDHLKAVFEKAGVNSRRELIAKVVMDQYLPRLGDRIGTSGWFRPTPLAGSRGADRPALRSG